VKKENYGKKQPAISLTDFSSAAILFVLGLNILIRVYGHIFTNLCILTKWKRILNKIQTQMLEGRFDN
jgi:hypothetical protein